MTKYLFLISIIFSAAACTSSTQKDAEKTKDSNEVIPYSKNDLLKIKWIEGKWRGLAGNNPFYEIYQFANDTTIMITTYEWNGTDSSKTSVDILQWKADSYYLGKGQNYKVTAISDTEIKMIPVKAANDILWKIDRDSGWVATLQGKNGTVVYHMKPFDPFKK